MFIVSDLDGNIITCNRATIDKLEYSYSELIEMNLLELHPQDRREQASLFSKEMLNKERKFCPIPFISKSKELLSVESRLWTGKWDKKDCIYLIAKDLTEENETLQVFTKMFESNPLPMSVNDLKNRSFIRVNPAFLEKTGYRKEDIIGKNIDKIDLFVDRNKIKAAQNRKKMGQEVNDEEFYIRRKDGRLLKCLLSIEDVTIQGKESVLSVMVDITERDELAKSVEDKLQKLTNVIDGTSLGTWEWDTMTGKMVVNQHFADMIGYSLEELENCHVRFLNKLMNEEDLELSKVNMRDHLKGKTEYYHSEIRMRHKNGSWVWINHIGKVTKRNKDGIATKLFGTYSDISGRKKAEIELKESEERFLLALDKTKAGLWDINTISGDVFFSPTLKRILGYEDHEIKNSIKELESLSHKDDLQKLKKAVVDYLEGKTKHYEMSHRLKHKDGSWRWILTRGGIIKDEDGEVKRWIGTNIDVTEEYERSLEVERFFSINLDLLCILDLKGRFVKTNKSWGKLLGGPSEDIEGQRFEEYIHPNDLVSTKQVMKKLTKDGSIENFVNRYFCADGKYHSIEWKANLYEDVIYAAARDVTERIAYEKQLIDISNRDMLTDIYNRRYIYKRAKEIIEEYKRTDESFSVCIIDIDNFKEINDTYGHQIGDGVLKKFTKIIESNLRPYDMLGRYGGEEFIIILKRSDIATSISVINRILQVIRATSFRFYSIDINLTFSAGISNSKEIKKENITVNDLVRLADKRMYEAKNIGKNKVVGS